MCNSCKDPTFFRNFYLGGGILNKRGRPKNWYRLANEFIDEIKKTGYSKSWIRKLRNALITDGPFFDHNRHPRFVSRDDYVNYISYLVEQYENPDYRRQKLSCVNSFLSRHENYVSTSVKLKWEHWEPKNVSWLTWDEVLYLWTLPMTPIERAMVWMMSRMACRRVEVLRAQIDDINITMGKFFIRGKGGSGTKARKIHIPPSGFEFIPQFNIYREQCIERLIQEEGPNSDIPNQWLIYWSDEKAPKLRTLKDTKFDELIGNISERSGMQFTSHTFRRSFLRHLYIDLGIEPVRIIKISGHSSPKHLLRYIGINDDDVKDVMENSENMNYKKERNGEKIVNEPKSRQN